MDAAEQTRDFAKQMRRKLTLPEGLLWRAIKGRKAEGLHFRKQHPIGPYILDFYCASAKLAVEVDGLSHGLGRNPERDAFRDQWLLDKGIRTLRLRAGLVLEDIDVAVRMVVSAARGGGGEF